MYLCLQHKCIYIQWHLVHSQGCLAITTISPEHSIPPKESPPPLVVTSSPPAPRTHLWPLPVHGGACSGHVTHMEPHPVWPSLSGSLSERHGLRVHPRCNMCGHLTHLTAPLDFFQRESVGSLFTVCTWGSCLTLLTQFLSWRPQRGVNSGHSESVHPSIAKFQIKDENPCFSTLTLSIKCVGFPLHPNSLVILPSQLGVLQFSPLLTLPTWRWHQTPQVRGWFRPDGLYIRCQSQVQTSRTSHWPAAKCRLPQPPARLAQTPRTQEIHLLR